MQKFISRHALAAHLAVMAVAPLFLLPFAGSAATAVVLLWLSAFGVVWVLLEPSRRRSELPHEARMRVSRAILRDPLFWFSLVLIGYAGIRAFNGGIALSYDAETMSWTIAEPAFPFLPGGVDGTGFLPFAVLVALAVIFQGTRHALGRSARATFLFVLSLASSLAAIVLMFAISYRHAGVLALMRYSVLSASSFGVTFGLSLLAGLVAFFVVVRDHWVKVEPLAALALVGNALGVTVFSPPLMLVVFLAAFLLLTVVSFVLERHELEGSGSLRCALTVMMTLGAPVLYVLATPEMSEKVSAIVTLSFFPDGFTALRDTLSGIALKTWKANPWLGTGLGSFPLDIRFGAVQSDWAIVSPVQRTALNGWWQLLAERGVIGAGMMAVALGILLWTYVSRLIDSVRAVHFSSVHLLGPLAVLALVALAFFDCSYLRSEVLLVAGSLMAFSSGAFPERIREVKA